jgi:cytochrome c-type biogenesis protein CcmE
MARMKRKTRRLYAVLGGLGLLGAAAALALSAFEDNLVFFYGPSELTEKGIGPGQTIRIGGLVEEDSLERLDDGLTVAFRVTDFETTLPVRYTGVLPDLFREGQGVVAEGALEADGTFVARQVLAKHDETYMPPEVAATLRKSGHWEEGAE